jgi:hypothetical protein
MRIRLTFKNILTIIFTLNSILAFTQQKSNVEIEELQFEVIKLITDFDSINYIHYKQMGLSDFSFIQAENIHPKRIKEEHFKIPGIAECMVFADTLMITTGFGGKIGGFAIINVAINNNTYKSNLNFATDGIPRHKSRIDGDSIINIKIPFKNSQLKLNKLEHIANGELIKGEFYAESEEYFMITYKGDYPQQLKLKSQFQCEVEVYDIEESRIIMEKYKAHLKKQKKEQNPVQKK